MVQNHAPRPRSKEPPKPTAHRNAAESTGNQGEGETNRLKVAGNDIGQGLV